MPQLKKGHSEYVTCKGGPWAGYVALFPQTSGVTESLIIRIGKHVGTYNFFTGVWKPYEKNFSTDVWGPYEKT